MKQQSDSIYKAHEEEARQSDSIKKLAACKTNEVKTDSAKTVNNAEKISDSTDLAQKNDASGIFAGSLNGSKKIITIETELAKFKFSNLGGRIYSVNLKKYRTFDSLPLILMNGDSNLFRFVFYSNNRLINTDRLYFQTVFADKRFNEKDSISLKGADSLKFAMRLFPDSASNPNKNKYIEILYTLYANNYMTKIQVGFVGLNDILVENSNSINLEWKMKMLQQEKSLKNEHDASTIYYKYYGDDVDYLSETKNDNKELTTKVSWIGFKQQFFSSVLIADKGFLNAKINTVTNDSNKREVKTCFAQIAVPFDESGKQNFEMQMYFGPNHFKTLKKYKLDLERQIPLGWSSPYILGWINRWAVIPVFNFLDSFNINYGIIILILTILLKIVLFPIAYKTYFSSAKMRVLKPEIDEINKKIPKEKAMERQQATMALYKKAGVNPLAGCIPMLLQMPILIALYRFFPASIELRQQHFLWATDLSSYDSIYEWTTQIPILSSVYGNHISLFTILMTVSTIFYTKLNNKLMGSQQQMPGMQFMTYAMPIMFLGFFNNFSAGLSYYYFLANMITFLQMWIIRRFVNEEAIHLKIQENRKRPDNKKKSGFQKRLEDMAKQRGYKMPK
ncbi:MAG: membrane protein insertase YidC [Bacteroidetes bacterium]|nr:membrane protein insertase YidC [Bacteroidota bacterium]